MNKQIFFVATILLAACAQQNFSVEPLPPEQVIKNAAQASVLLESVAFTSNVTFRAVGSLGAIVDGEIHAQGSLHQSGEDVQMNADVSANVLEDIGRTSLQAEADIIVKGPQEIYIRLNKYTATGERQFLPAIVVGFIKGTWVNVGPGVESAPSGITPNPSLLYAQAQVIIVEEELPPAMIQNRVHYHYNVRVDNQKFIEYVRNLSVEQGDPIPLETLQEEYQNLDVRGEIWIDAENFHIRKLYWKIAPFTSQNGASIQANVEAEFSNHNNANPIFAPEDAISPRDLLFMDAISGGVSPEMQLNTQQNIIESLIETSEM